MVARLRFTSVMGFGILLLLAIATFLPVLIMLELSLKNNVQFEVSRWTPSYPFHGDNYLAAWLQARSGLLNSFEITVVGVAITLTAASLTAYAIARYDFPGRWFFYYAIISLLMIPGILTLITRFWMVMKLDLINNYFGIWLPMAATSQVFHIFVLRTFFASLPEELFEAGRIDGASELQMLRAIALPLSRPIIATLAVLESLTIWNEFIWPLMVITDPAKMPISVSLLYFQGIYQTDWGPLFAGYTLAAIPLFALFAFTSQQFIRGLTSGAIKI